MGREVGREAVSVHWAKAKRITANLTSHLFLLGCETTTNGLLSRFLFLGKALLQRG